MRGQVSVEFMFIIIAASLMLLTFTVVFSEMYQDTLSDKRVLLEKDFAYSIRNEFVLAAQVRQGYTRSFELDDDLEGYDYTISVQNNVLNINNRTLLSLPPVKGNITKGLNVIQNINNSLCLNC